MQFRLVRKPDLNQSADRDLADLILYIAGGWAAMRLGRGRGPVAQGKAASNHQDEEGARARLIADPVLDLAVWRGCRRRSGQMDCKAPGSAFVVFAFSSFLFLVCSCGSKPGSR